MSDSASASALSSKYQRKTDKQHILDNPDTYIGSVEKVDQDLWVVEDPADCGGLEKIVQKTIEYIPGLYKLFDEGIVNCRDHIIRMLQLDSETKKYVTYIKIDIDPVTGIIVMENDGNGIDIAKHPVYGIWIPELIFGHLRTSTNYDKTEKKIVGGKNGFGFKLVLIWSSWGKIETVDHTRGLKYTQEFHNNLNDIDPPKILSLKGAAANKPYTRISFRPDYTRLGMVAASSQPSADALQQPIISADLMRLLQKRIYDIGAISDHSVKKIKVTYNDAVVPVKNFQQYINLYIGERGENPRVYEEANERWEYAVALSPTHEFTQISFVNGISTYKGGKHVDYIVGQIIRRLIEYIEKKKKTKVNPNSIKEQLMLFLRCDIENPSFDSQTKDYMNTPSAKFGSSCSVSDAFIEKVAKMGVMDLACTLTEAKENKNAAKKTDGSKVRTVRNIANLIDANFAGTNESNKCTLILCEGLSASSGIVSGLSSNDRNIFGIYPLKGKLLNIRGEQAKRIADNKEITDIKKILGLEQGRKYKDMADIGRHLRYSKIMFMCDADADGSHIKGLCINLFHSEWQSLFKIAGFLSFMNTPILRATKGAGKQAKQLLFYNDGEYHTWKHSITAKEYSTWTIKYFKGLGTSTATEFKEYFKNKKIVDFVYNGESSDDILDMVFNKKRANERKDWLEAYDKNAYLDTSKPTVVYDEFINKELIHFSIYDCERSLPCVVDGLKTSLRKVLFCAFKRNLTTEVKVAQFSGYVSEHSCYHHGEASLNGAIVGMAQDFTGSNNINLLMPKGQFGTARLGGKDSASERYIFTHLNPITRAIFPAADDGVLNYLEDDGQPIEPDFYIPIIPFALVNGIQGIGTGYSCEIPSFNPLDLIRYLQALIRGEAATCDQIAANLTPYYRGFKGTITQILPQKYLVKGVYERIGSDRIRITELPVKTWITPYTEFLEELVDGVTDKKGVKQPAVLKDFTSVSTEKDVNITVVFPIGQLDKLEEDRDNATGINGVEKLLKLTSTISCTNMHLFDANLKLHKYETLADIIADYYKTRLEAYRRRIAAVIVRLEEKHTKYDNQMKYIMMSLDGRIDLRKKSGEQVTTLLETHAFIRIADSFNYLVKMPMDSVTNEHVDKLVKETADIRAELEYYRNVAPETIWMQELDVLKTGMYPTGMYPR